MYFYNQQHQHYCGIDLHARSLYVCILDRAGEVLLHKECPAKADKLLKLITPYLDDLVLGVECMHCWYWVADFCEDKGIAFILGHALYMRAIHGGKAKNDRIDSLKIAQLMRGGNFPLAYVYPREMRSTRDLLRRRTNLVRHGANLKAHVANTTSQYNLPPNKVNLKNVCAREQLRHTFEDQSAQCMIDLDMAVLECYSHELSQVEWYLEQQAKAHQPVYLNLLRTIPGIGRVLALTILYEIGDIKRFETVQQFASYSRLVKCKAESADKSYGTQGNKIGNGHLKWAFSEALYFISGVTARPRITSKSCRSGCPRRKRYRLWRTSSAEPLISC